MNKHLAGLCHVALWAFLFLSPLTFWRGTGIKFMQYLMYCMQPAMLMVVFYLNYLYLAPKFFVAGKHRYDLLINVVMITVFGISLHYWIEFANDLFGVHPRFKDTISDVTNILRNCLNFCIFAGGSTKTEAELKNLRSQINPHFLLNTLNNIYALTAIDQTKAQEAIQQLSKLLRHMLYDNQEPFVALQDEIQFLENYVSLMKIRLSQNVEVTFDKHVKDPYLKVAPLLFISLVENAFKHGVSPTEHSFVHIMMEEDGNRLCVTIENSYHPKNEQDRSGHGIGLNQVQRRLDLAYPARYEWQKGVSEDNKIYTSQITIIL